MTCRGPFQVQMPDLDSPEDPNWAVETGPRDLPIMTRIRAGESQSQGEKDANYKDLLPNHLLKVNRKSRQLPKCAQTSHFRARKSNRATSKLQFNSILKFTGKQKIRKGFERSQ